MKVQPETPINILIVDDHELVRDGIRARLELHDDIHIVGEALNGREAIIMAKRHTPDLVMMDINMPEMNGLDATAAMREAGIDCAILILSIYDNSEYVRRARSLGVNGYLLKDASHDEMIEAIGCAARGDFYLSPGLSNALDEPPSDEKYGLSEREREVLAAIAQGKLNKQIAYELSLSVRTIESHRSAIREKTGGGNAARLARIAGELGLA